MTDRGVPSTDGSPACPFVAFADDRDERGDRPDRRHRCYAEAEPAPRALAHQEAYCLSSAFPVCPTFQEWARREAAHATHVAATAAGRGDEQGDGVDAVAAGAGVAGAGLVGAAAVPGDDEPDDLWSQARDQPPIEERPRRNPPRDWAAPPPWASAPGGGASAGRRESPRSERPVDADSTEDEGRGLAGSAADRLARGGEVGEEWGHRPSPRPRSAVPDSPSAPADPELAGLVGRSARHQTDEEHYVRPPTRAGRRPTVSSTRERGRERDRDREREERHERHDGPAWERARRYEAFPSIKTRAGLSGFPAIPTVGVLFGGVILAAIILFFLPAVLGVGGPDGGVGGSPSPSASATPTPEPTPIPEPTPQVYVIKSGDTLSRIARQFNVTLDALLEANKDRISNPNRIRVGDEIIIPLPVTEEPAAEPSPS